MTVAGQGTWTVDSDGNVTFTPQADFTKDPTPITYTVSDATGKVSNQATITIQSLSRIPGTTQQLAGGFTHASGNRGGNVVAVLWQYS